MAKQKLTSENDFGDLLKKGVRCIVAHQGLTVSGARIVVGGSCTPARSPDAVEKWEQGRVLPRAKFVEACAGACVELGRMDRGWLWRFLQKSGHPAIEIVMGRIMPDEITTGFTKFWDDVLHDRAEIFRRVMELTSAAREQVWTLSSHTLEPSLKVMRQELHVQNLYDRLAVANKIISQHAHYNRLIQRAQRNREFQYIRLVQVPGGVIDPQNTGYHYLRHFYRMLEVAHRNSAGLRVRSKIQVLLDQGPPMRNTTFVGIDNDTVIIQITGIREDGSYELRGVQIIQDARPDGDPRRWKQLFQRLRDRTEIAHVQFDAIAQFEEARRPLGEMIQDDLYDLLRDVIYFEDEAKRWRIETCASLLLNMIGEEDITHSVPTIVEQLMDDHRVRDILEPIFNSTTKYHHLNNWWLDHFIC